MTKHKPPPKQKPYGGSKVKDTHYGRGMFVLTPCGLLGTPLMCDGSYETDTGTKFWATPRWKDVNCISCLKKRPNIG